MAGDFPPSPFSGVWRFPRFSLLGAFPPFPRSFGRVSFATRLDAILGGLLAFLPRLPPAGFFRGIFSPRAKPHEDFFVIASIPRGFPRIRRVLSRAWCIAWVLMQETCNCISLAKTVSPYGYMAIFLYGYMAIWGGRARVNYARAGACARAGGAQARARTRACGRVRTHIRPEPVRIFLRSKFFAQKNENGNVKPNISTIERTCKTRGLSINLFAETFPLTFLL